METTTTAWASVLTAPGTLEFQATVPATEPVLAPGEVLVEVAVGGICGSDLPFFLGHGSPLVPAGTPGFPLHEVAGVAIASAADNIAVGDHVVGWATGQDGLRSRIVSGGHSLHAHSPALAPEIAIMLQPLACVLYAVEQIGDVAGQHAAVLGMGPIGALFAHVLKNRGAARVTAVDRVDRSDVAPTFGVDTFAHADAATWAAGLTDEQRATVVVEAIGHQVETLTAAINAAAYEGKVFYFGIPNDEVYPLPMNGLLRKNLTLQSGVTSLTQRSRVLAEAEAYLAAHPDLVPAYLTSTFAFSEAGSAFEAATHPRPGQLKVTLAAR